MLNFIKKIVSWLKRKPIVVLSPGVEKPIHKEVRDRLIQQFDQTCAKLNIKNEYVKDALREEIVYDLIQQIIDKVNALPKEIERKYKGLTRAYEGVNVAKSPWYVSDEVLKMTEAEHAVSNVNIYKFEDSTGETKVQIDKDRLLEIAKMIQSTSRHSFRQESREIGSLCKVLLNLGIKLNPPINMHNLVMKKQKEELGEQ